jgi:hypothetical protein
MMESERIWKEASVTYSAKVLSHNLPEGNEDNYNNPQFGQLIQISGSRGGEHEHGCLLGCSAVETGTSVPPNFRYLLPPSADSSP